MRPGLIIGGRCVMAPSVLDPAGKVNDAQFLNRAKNGVQVTVDGQIPAAVTSWNEYEGWVDCAVVDAETNALKLHHDFPRIVRLEGDVRAHPGS